MATSTRKVTTIHKDLVADPASLSKPQRRQAALDRWQELDQRITLLSKQRLTARDEALSLGQHGKTYSASDGTNYMFRDEKVDTQNHAKVAAALAARLGLTEKQVEAEYEKVKGTTTKREIKKI